MADGTDEAASAFQAEIAPASQPDRPRDQGGRFVASQDRMFGERPIEGDPETGDTSDGGDDARLRNLERREADGWTQQRDGQTLPDKPARARLPANDNQHQGFDKRSANDNEPPEQIGEGPDDEAGADEKPDDGPENPEEVGPKYQVTVDGQTLEVSLPEALKGYVREQTFYQRMQKVSEAAQAVQQEAATTVQLRDAYVQRLEHQNRTFSSLIPQIDWDKERAADPAAAWEKMKAVAQIQGVVQWNAQEMQREAQERAAEYDKKSAEYAHTQFAQFVQEANIPDEKTLNEDLTLMRTYARKEGFGEGEIATIYDKRMMKVLRKAALYDQQQNEQLPKPVQPGKGRALVPGASTPRTREVGRRSIDEAQTKLARSGRLDDAAAVFQRILR